MSRFFSRNFAALTPYTPGEQPQDKQYVKLNTNESPFPPSARAQAMAAKAAQNLQLYPDPTCRVLRQRLGALYGLTADEVIVTNGSDEVLNFAFMAFCDNGAIFPDITYGFYRVFADLYRIPCEEIPLNADFTIAIEDYKGRKETVFIANPNAPTGIPLSVGEIEEIVASNPDRVVVVDEAYVDFGGESCVPLVTKYDNLLVTGTFSKSRSMAGARLGFGFACPALIRDLETLRYSTNPYNINRLTMAAGLGQLADEEETRRHCRTVVENRQYTITMLSQMGFDVLPSAANFVFAKYAAIDGKELYLRLKEKGILVRHFDKPRLKEYNRITIGSREQMDALLTAVKEILEDDFQ
ncbi:MAG: histidinol-phosphate transaminase [Clostridia bacterium]|nr:histidinol-phosphate transaminase [Clostridia bacterium]